MIILDTNILISALIKDSETRKLIIESGFRFAYPEISLLEIKKYEQYILKKAGYTETTYKTILNKLLEYINLIPLGVIRPELKKAKEIMEKIDINDIIFIAAALALDNSIIWSNDADFDKQKAIRALKTKDLLEILEK